MATTDIVAYTYAAETYCPECIVKVLPTGEGQAYDGWALAPGADSMTTEANLDEIARRVQALRPRPHHREGGCVMAAYARVTYRPEGGRARTVTLGDVTVTEHLVTGTVVDGEGSTVWTKGGTTCTKHVIDRDLVVATTPMRMDFTYGLLVPEAPE